MFVSAYSLLPGCAPAFRRAACAAALAFALSGSAAAQVTIVQSGLETGPTPSVSTSNALPSPRVVSLMMDGAQNLQQNHLLPAIKSLSDAAHDPSAPAGVYRLLAQAYLRDKRAGDSIASARRAVDLSPPRSSMQAENRLLLAKACYADFRSQYDHVTAQLKELPGYAQLLGNMAIHTYELPNGDVLIEKGDLDAPDALNHEFEQIRAAVRQMRSDLSMGEDAAKLSLDQDSTLGEAHDTLGLIYCARGENSEARREFEAEIADCGPTAKVIEHLGELELRLGNYDEAIADLQRSAMMGPSQASVYESLAEAYELTDRKDQMRYATALNKLYRGHVDEARKQIDQLPPSSCESLLGRALIADVQNDTKTARSLAQKAVSADPSNVTALCVLGDLQSQDNDCALAARSYDRALTLDPKCSSAWFGKGYVLDQQNNLPGAVAAYKQALALNAEDYPALINCSTDRAEMRDTAGAVAELQRYVKRFPLNEDYFQVQSLLQRLENQMAS